VLPEGRVSVSPPAGPEIVEDALEAFAITFATFWSYVLASALPSSSA